ncbi:MAG: hypothetical protein NT001_06945 [Candidatus Woesearchaeota archaeon]|nr:hypothetical protein [Candidatus Woesearchaeota archaeon]
MLKKRGQLTVFIIIGLLMLAFLGIFLYMRQTKTSPATTETEVIPENLVPIRQYVESCMQKTAKDAVVLLGMQAGYIYMPDRIAYDPSSYILIGGVKVPYWYYQGNSRVPSIDGMQSDINQYIEENLRPCVSNFMPFSNQFDINEDGNITVDSRIVEGKVTVSMRYPLSVKARGEESSNKITIYNAEMDVGLKNAYELSKEIFAAENSQMFLEDVTIDLMTAGSDIPFTDISFECGQKQWSVLEISGRVKNLLFYNLPKIKLMNTNYEPYLAHPSKYELLKGYTPEDIGAGKIPKDVPADAYDYFHFRWDAATNDYSSLTAYVNFQKDWDFRLYARPSKGDTMMSSWDRGDPDYYLSYLCINAYHFTYDVIYPVEMMIRDNSAFNGDGYAFKFAMPVLINHNKGDRSNFPITLYEYPDQKGGEYCNDLSSNSISFYVKDKKTMQEIPDVNITLNCMNTYYCSLGTTDFGAGVNRLVTKLPKFCMSPSIEATHKDYIKSTKTISEDATYVDMMMTPVKTMDFRVVKQRLTGTDLQKPEELEGNETVILSLSTGAVEDFNIFRKYPLDAGSPADFATIRLPDDKISYRLEMTLIGADGSIIGGFRGNWTVNDKSLQDKSMITFKVMEKIPNPGTIEQQGDLLMQLESGEYKSQLMPVFS